MRCLSIDLGTKTCGVAISDKTNTIAVPYDFIKFKENDYNELAIKLNKIIENEIITHLIIGKPINMDGSHGFATKRSDELIKYLNNVDIKYIDERLTTKSAIDILHNVGKKVENNKEKLDVISAILILENYLKVLNEK